MRFFYFGFALALLSLSASAQDKKDATPPSSTSVVVNGQTIKGKVLEIDGRHYVAVEDLAQSLRGTIAYGDGQIMLTLSKLPSGAGQAPSPQSTSTIPQPPSSAMPSVTAQPLVTGSIKGTLTYFFDFHTGNKPDSGTKVWLVKGHAEIPANQNFIATSTTLGTSANPQQYSASQHSTADENGNFELLDIPAGSYTLILQSAHTKWTLNDKRDFFGRGNGHNPRDSGGRVEFLAVIVKPGETAEASKDFGPNIDK
jgi:hypothetical protein